jgi:hypothetical protein
LAPVKVTSPPAIAAAFELLEALHASFANDEKFHVNHLKAAERSENHVRAMELARRGLDVFRFRPRYARSLYESAFMLDRFADAREAAKLLHAVPQERLLAAALELRLAFATGDQALHAEARRALLEELARGAVIGTLPPLLRQLASVAVAEASAQLATKASTPPSR